ncbi:MAG: SPFH domain-containing protein [Deltaproteobacteria bacterium]
MTLRDFLVGELIDIIEWLDESGDTMAWRFSRPGNEIKNGAELIVRPAQLAIFIDQGRIADVFRPGRHTLTTANLPLLSSIRGWKYGFASPFKADVLFVNTKQFTNQKWGTSSPVILTDPGLGPVRLRAYGTYAVRVVDPAAFVRELVGTNSTFIVEQIADQLRDLVVAKVSGVLATGQISVFELAGKYAEVGARVLDQVAPQFQQYGLGVTQLVIENVSLPPEVEATIDQKTRMNMLGDLDRYTQLQSADAIRDAARNPSGGAAAGVGIGMGAALGQRAMASSPGSAAGATSPAPQASEPPPLPTDGWYYAVGSERRGPISASALQSEARITADTLVWRAGMKQWTPASAVPELATIFSPKA